jgi:ribokinase
MRVGVVGHVEVVEFALVDRVPAAGEIVFASGPTFTEVGGGGAITAVWLRRAAGAAAFFTSVGGDAAGAGAAGRLRDEHGLELHAAVRDVPQRRAFTHLDREGERTITVLGERHVPHGADPLPWAELAGFDAVYFAAGDAAALRAARAARCLVATPRALDAVAGHGVEVDVVVASASDPGERVEPGAPDPPPRVVVLTEGAAGGRWDAVDGRSGRWDAVAPPGPAVDAFACGDAFAAGLTCGLGAGLGIEDAVALGARCGAAAVAGRGPYGGLGLLASPLVAG